MMIRMADADHATRRALLDAGVLVAERDGWAAVSINSVVTAAGVAKGTFYVHFATRQAFAAALIRRFFEATMTAVLAAIEGRPAGRERLLRGSIVYLDECLSQRGAKVMLTSARGDPEVAEDSRLINEAAASLIARDLTAMGWKSPQLAARLFLAMLVEAALIEMQLGRRAPSVRTALHAYLGR